MLLPRPQLDYTYAEHLVFFSCPRCRHQAKAMVSSMDEGLKLWGVALNDREAAGRAAAEKMAHRVPCPRCGRMGRAALGPVLLLGALVGSIAAACAGLWAHEQYRDPQHPTVAAFGFALAAFAASVVVTTWLKLRAARQCVRFLRPE